MRSLKLRPGLVPGPRPLILAFAALLMAGGGGARAMTVAFLGFGEAQEARGEVVLEAVARQEADGRGPAVWRAAVSAKGEEKLAVGIPLGATERYRARVVGEDVWGETVEFLGRDAGDLRLRAWPKTAVRADVRGLEREAEDGTTGETVRIVLRQPLPTAPVAAGAQWEKSPVEASCAVGDRLECALPAGRWHVKFELEGYASVFLWDASFQPGKESKLAPLVFVPGASVNGYMALSDGSGRGPSQGAARLFPAAGRMRQTIPQLDTLPQMERTVAVSADGFFQFSGVAPGRYELVVEHPGYTPARRTLVLDDVAEFSLPGAIELTAAIDLFTITVEPERGPDGGDWNVNLALENVRDTRQEETVDGVATFSQVGVGEHRLWIRDRAGNKWYSRELKVDGAETTARVALPVVAVAGELLLGGEPLAGTPLSFVRWDNTQYTKMETDEEGRFQGAVPGPGSWLVRVESEVLGGSRTLPEQVEVEAEGENEFSLDLPGGALEGFVRHLEGGEVESRISVLDLESTIRRPVASLSTSDEGHFEVVALRASKYRVTARNEAGDFAEAEVEVDDGVGLPIELFLEPVRRISAVVRSGDQPLAAAEIKPVGSHNRGRTVHTGADGTQEVEVPPGTDALLVTAPGRPVRIVPWNPDQGEVAIELGDAGGTLTLEMAEAILSDLFAARTAGELEVTFTYDGVTINGQDLVRVLPPDPHANLTTGSFHNLHPGGYRLCLTMPSHSYCGSAQVSAGGSANVTLGGEGDDR